MKFTKTISHLILSCFPGKWRDKLRGVKRFTFGQKQFPKEQLIIFFVDGLNFHGGFADRMKGIISVFHYCLCRNITFKIKYTYPFELTDFFQPNDYNWQLQNENTISYNLFETELMDLTGDGSVERLVDLKTKKQIHVYANQDSVDKLNAYYKTNYTWGELFRKLFKPTEMLQHAINEHQEYIGNNYICAVFRFQNLLGDFQEYEYLPLNEPERNELINKCKTAIFNLQKRNAPTKTVVTSDSELFLKNASGLENVIAFPAKLVHMDTVDQQPGSAYAKSFIDFYLISKAEKVCCIGTKEMYPTEFPLYAAKVHNIPFERILIE